MNAAAVAVLAFVVASQAGSAASGARTVTYATVGTLAIQADVFRPTGPGPFPVVLWIHGGALIFGDRGMLPAEQRDRYLRAGLAVVSIDYRLAPETKLAAILEDLDAAHRWLLRDGPSLGLDPKRIAVVGHSGGGYLSLMAGMRFRPRPSAVVSFYGYGDVAGEWYSRPDPGYLRDPPVSQAEAWRSVGKEPLSVGEEDKRFAFYLYARQQGQWPQLVTGHDPDREPRAFDAFCPVRNVTGDFPPTLLVHGDRDEDVPYAQSVAMARALAAASVTHEFLTLPGRGHVFDLDGLGMKDPLVDSTFDRVVAFLSEHLATTAAPPTPSAPRSPTADAPKRKGGLE